MTHPNADAELQTIGRRLPKIDCLPETLGSTPTPSPPSSSITGDPCPDKRGSSLTGRLPSATAAVKNTNTKLLDLAPSLVDAHLAASLPPSVICALKAVTLDRTGSLFGWDREFVGYELVPEAQIPHEDWPALDRTIKLHQRACATAPKDIIAKELAAVRVLTKARAEHQDDMKFMFAVYAEKLSDYPADVVMHVLKTQADMSIWWPSWMELKDRLDLHGKKRMRRLKALCELREKSPSPRPSPQRGEGAFPSPPHGGEGQGEGARSR